MATAADDTAADDTATATDASIAGEKQPLKINYDELLGADADEPAANIVVVSSVERRRRRRQTESKNNSGDELLSQKSDGDLKEQIDRLKKIIPRMSLKLPDKGGKLNLQLDLLEAEWQRRCLRKTTQVADRCKNPEQGRRNFNGESDGLKREAHSSQTPECSEFACRFREKMENDAKPETEQNTSFKVRNAFQDGMSCISPCDKRKRAAGVKASVSKKEKPGSVSKDFFPWKHSNGSRSQRNYVQLDEFLASRPFSQEKLPGTFTVKNASKILGSESANDDKEECTVVLVDEEEPEVIERIQETEKRHSRRNGCRIFYPSREDPNSLEIFRSELKCLEPGECLTSTIMNFYIRFLQQRCSTSDNSKQFYFFNTYFYSKLQEAVARQNEETYFIKFRRWWKGVNIFEKTYIFLPVNEDKHWSLVIVCISDEEDSRPIILHLDSLGLHSSTSIFNNVRSLLENEWKYLKENGEAVNIAIPDTLKFNFSEKIEGKTIEAPRQTNDYDCGLFVLYYIEQFIQDAPEKMKEEHFSKFGKKWFKAQEASSLRGKIKRILTDEFQKAPIEDPIFQPVCLPMVAKPPKAAHRVDIS